MNGYQKGKYHKGEKHEEEPLPPLPVHLVELIHQRLPGPLCIHNQAYYV
jgi:hypothetical protein